MHRNDKQNRLKGLLLAAALLAMPLAANAAGMGKITVLSALGQPLRAELDVSASREEMASLTARVAPVEAFRQANLDYAGVLSTIRFTLDKRSDGKPYFKIQTERPVNDPFIDFLVELNWSSGRLVREYAFLLDPPEMKQEAAPVAAPPVVPPVTASAPESATPAAPVESAPAAPTEKESAPVPAAVSAPAAPEVKAAATATRKVAAGDTLGKIARESAGAGVSLDQMLVALFNRNRDVFDSGNMNRLRAGKILTIPQVEEAAAVSPAEARKIIVAQSADFNAYRNRLAAAAAAHPAAEETPQQSSAGKITPKVEEKAPVAAGKDKLQVSRSEAEAKTAKGKPSEEDTVARDKALKEANARIAELEKNLTSLKQLAELKSQAAAAAQTPAPAVAAAVAKPEPAAPTPPAVVANDKSVSATAAAPALSATAAAETKPAEEMPKPKKKHMAPAPPPPPPPSFIEDNPLIVYGGGAALAGLLGFAGFLFWKRRRNKTDGQDISVSDLAANSVFGGTASPQVDSGAVTPTAPESFGDTTTSALEQNESTDPIEQAELYMAYGRDGQAEEVLLDALQKDGGNLAVHLKLLEIYAARKSLPQFSTVAGDLHMRTGGAGAQWDKAVALGKALDPNNPLYGGGAATPVAPAISAAHDQTQVMAAAPVAEPPVTPPPAEEEAPSVMDFDLDLGAVDTAPVAESSAPVAATSDIDFDLELGGGETPAAPAVASTSAIDADHSIDFNFDLGGDTATAGSDPAAPAIDLSEINLDLGESSAGDSPEVATKLELAQAYEEMGDKEGARELLQEVLAEGSSAQQEKARSKLAQLG